MHLDIPTLALVTGCISMMLVFAFAMVWVLNRNIPGLGCWTLCSLLSVGSVVLVLLRQVTDATLITKLLATLLAWTGAVFFHVGAASFQGRKPSLKWPLIGCVSCLAGYIWFGWVAEQIWLRPLFYTPPMVMFLALGARELFQEQRTGMRFAAHFIGYASCCYALALTFRALMLSAGMANPEPLLSNPLQALAFSVTLLWLLCWAFATVLLVNQWQNLEKIQFQDAKIKASEELAWAEKALAVTERELAAERAERQRALMVRDLHDGLGGLTANLVLLSSMGRGEDTSSERHDLMQHIEHLAVECNREVRMLMDALHQGSIDWRQFLQELREYSKHVAAGHRFTLNWHIAGEMTRELMTDVAAQISLMRCLKEAVNNLARHSGACAAMIRVRFFKRYLGVTIGDNGVGLGESEAQNSTGNGLRNMRHRCEELGGRLSFFSNAGTTLRFVIPLPVRLAPIAKKPPFSDLATKSEENQDCA